MTVDELLQSLRNRPRPRLNPFFAARVAQKTRRLERTRVPWIVRLYWIVFACFAAFLLLPTAAGVPIAIIAAAVTVFPERVLLLGAMLMRE